MASVDHSLPEGMTEAEAKQKIKEFVDGRREALTELLEALVAEVTALKEAQTDAVHYGHNVALKSSNGYLVCAQDGGPTQTGKVFEFQSRDVVGPHELFTLLK